MYKIKRISSRRARVASRDRQRKFFDCGAAHKLGKVKCTWLYADFVKLWIMFCSIRCIFVKIRTERRSRVTSKATTWQNINETIRSTTHRSWIRRAPNLYLHLVPFHTEFELMTFGMRVQLGTIVRGGEGGVGSSTQNQDNLIGWLPVTFPKFFFSILHIDAIWAAILDCAFLGNFEAF